MSPRGSGGNLNVAEAIAAVLADAGVKDVFGLVGSGNFAVTNALVASGSRFIAARHECAAVAMADGYARVTGRTGVASVHQGPGLTNALTAVTEAAKARTPLLLLAADTTASAVRSNFRIDQMGLAASVGAVPERIHSAETAMDDLHRAFRTAVEQRRAVVLNMPLDIQATDLPERPHAGRWAGPDPVTPSRRSIELVTDLIQRSGRPIILAGRGAVIAKASGSVQELGDMIGALLASSANGNGLFATSEWGIGISGGFATPTAADLLREADLLLSFGASLNMWTTRHGSLVGERTRVVQIDVDADAVGRHTRADAALIADAHEAATALIAELNQRGYRSEGFRDEATAVRIAEGSWQKQPFEDGSTNTTIDPRSLSKWLDQALPQQRIVAIDSGHFMGWPAMYLRVPDASGFVFTQAFQSVGLGLASAIGASIGRPDRLTVACLGDGGALMAAGEFETIARLGLNMLVVVYNDSAYGAEVHHFGPSGHPLDTVRFPDTNFAALGEAVGAQGLIVRRVEDLKPVGDWLETRDRPLVLDAKITPDVIAEWLEEAFRAH